ncbi:electron transport complex subunit RsxG [Paraneptunicella aestuarii]|uniref:electron transport complex subunit RsxG n=1 Tax=Paraneptunicella aestuarii TaxID=2831148 RepID=UPI001E510695|nr:electron transport complex subunit RsxG [Paraneptunicella aestuarii]UAA37877.1 electron transport complex subunit RsxG [Paraneptunicella aestuarii]
MNETVLRHGLLLGLFALVTSGLIALTHWATADRIAAQERQTLLNTLNKIIPPAQYNNDVASDCTLVNAPILFGLNESGKSANQSLHLYRARMDDAPVALAVEAISQDGYSGQIKMLVSLLADGSIGGTRIIAHKETPGLGDKIEERVSSWITVFSGEPADNVHDSVWAVKKDGGKFDQFTGATITPRAVVAGVGNAVKYMQTHWDEAFSANATCGANE